MYEEREDIGRQAEDVHRGAALHRLRQLREAGLIAGVARRLHLDVRVRLGERGDRRIHQLTRRVAAIRQVAEHPVLQGTLEAALAHRQVAARRTRRRAPSGGRTGRRRCGRATGSGAPGWSRGGSGGTGSGRRGRRGRGQRGVVAAGAVVPLGAVVPAGFGVSVALLPPQAASTAATLAAAAIRSTLRRRSGVPASLSRMSSDGFIVAPLSFTLITMRALSANGRQMHKCRGEVPYPRSTRSNRATASSKTGVGWRSEKRR